MFLRYPVSCFPSAVLLTRVTPTIFVVGSYLFPNTLLLTLGTTTFTIIVMYLIMVTSRIELQRTTEHQVRAFVEKMEAVALELRGVSQASCRRTTPQGRGMVLYQDQQDAVVGFQFASASGVRRR